jgi:hypothetical protein
MVDRPAPTLSRATRLMRRAALPALMLGACGAVGGAWAAEGDYPPATSAQHAPAANPAPAAAAPATAEPAPSASPLPAPLLPAPLLPATQPPAQPLPSAVGLDPVVNAGGPAWQTLTAGQRTILAPLQDDWPNITPYQKDKWVELAGRYPTLSKTEQERIRERMADWSRMTAAERGKTRLNFQNATQTPPTDRQARWEAYQALPPEERQRLVERAAAAGPATPRPPAAVRRATPAAAATVPNNLSLSRTSATKANIVPNPMHAGTPRPVSASTIQAAPGATTTLVTKRPQPPVHQQTGLPKIAATPGMVDPATLLPRRGPQAAVAPLPRNAVRPKAERDD